LNPKPKVELVNAAKKTIVTKNINSAISIFDRQNNVFLEELSRYIQE
jgi:hypothetical protein